MTASDAAQGPPVGSSDRNRLDGRTALVTGGSGFLGQHWVSALSQAGAHVISVDLAEPVGVNVDGRFAHEQVDITDPAAVRDLARRLGAAGVTVDVLVNNAAIDAAVSASGLAAPERFETLSLERWQIEVGVGLTGAFLCCQAFGPLMAARNYGSIVNVGSDLGLIGPDQRLYRIDGVPDDGQPVKPVTYSVIKSGLIGLTRYLATYWGDRNVRANVLCLGGVERDQDPTFQARVSERIPLGRMARQGEYDDAMVFLCSDASSYMTGACLVIDGGRTTW
jgi:NAD(P)-dependent dehydrogenase (short-subunit alcohol dehydrogenase family)